MFNFFADQNARIDNLFIITGADYNHIKNVLRMRVGDEFLISHLSQSHLCKISNITDVQIEAQIVSENYLSSELPCKIYLFQALPKGDKMELIIQKAVELGAYGIIPVQTENCVVKLDEKKKESKRARWQAISESAAKQSKRNIIPEVFAPMSFKEALDFSKNLDLFLVPYENSKGMKGTKEAFAKIKKSASIGVFIGSEGGFTENEIEKTRSIGADIISLGSRILRAETAAITSLGAIMLYIETELLND